MRTFTHFASLIDTSWKIDERHQIAWHTQYFGALNHAIWCVSAIFSSMQVSHKWLLALFLAPLAFRSWQPGQAVESPNFARDIRPVLQEACLGCHNAKIKAGGLMVDSYEAMMHGGNHGAVIVPGHSEQSRLTLMLEGKIVPKMPLQGELKPDQIALIR